MSGPSSPSPGSPRPSTPPASTPPAAEPVSPRPTRYEATVHADRLALESIDPLIGVSDLDLDRVPDPEGGVRVLVDQDEIARLVDRGFEVRLHRAVPVQPLDPSLIATDADVDAWYSRRMSGTGER